MPSGGERRSGRALAAPLTLLAFVLSSAFSSPRALAVPDPAESVPSGTERSGDLVSIGKALTIAGEVDGAVIAIGGRVTVTGRVRGDLVVLGGDALVADGGRVGGDLLVVAPKSYALYFKDKAFEAALQQVFGRPLRLKLTTGEAAAAPPSGLEVQDRRS